MNNSPNTLQTPQPDFIAQSDRNSEPDLGAVALSTINFHTSNSIYGGYEVEEHENYIASVLAGELINEKDATNAKNRISGIREDMHQFSLIPEVAADVDNYFDKTAAVPDILKRVKSDAEAKKGNTISWCGWLAEDATDEQVLNFFQWHNNNHDTRARDPETARKFDSVKEEYVEDVTRLKNTGLLHEQANVTRAKLDMISFSLEDMFHAYMYGSIGFTNLEHTKIQLAENYDKQTVKHELNHAELGRYGEYLSDTWLDEALTDHIANAMEFGDELIVDPANRQGIDASRGYVPELGLLANILTKGNVPIDIRLFTRYYSAVSESARTTAKAELDKKIVEAYGDPDMLSKISECLKRATPETTHEENFYDDTLQALTEDPRQIFTTYAIQRA